MDNLPASAAAARTSGIGGTDTGRRRNKWWTLVAVCLGIFMLLLEMSPGVPRRPGGGRPDGPLRCGGRGGPGTFASTWCAYRRI